MTLSALLVCMDEEPAQVLSRVLEELSIGVESCPDFVRAGIRLAQTRFDVLIIAGGSTAQVVSLLRDSRQSRVNNATLAVVVVGGQETIREMFSIGVNFVLYKPVAYDRALSTLKAAREVMRKDKRKNQRAAVHTQATIDYANISQEKATLVDLSEEGMQVQFGKKLPPVSKIYFQFKLPDQTASVRLSGQVAWQEWSGRAGIQFVDVPKTSRRQLTDFLANHAPNGAQQDKFPAATVKFPEVTMEMDDGLQLVSVTEQTHGSAQSPSGAYQTAAVNAAVSDADNRRKLVRYSCRLGAEVYLTGTSVPNHCCLTDLSSGGCYLEVPLSLPRGASVEIVVRTYEMKLQLRGTVQASHPGYGAGVAFELRTKPEQANVNKLIDFVASTTEPS